MAAVSEIITLGIGTPSSIGYFVTAGLLPGTTPLVPGSLMNELSAGVIVTMVQNTVYSLPAMVVMVRSDAVVETSMDGSTFVTLTNANTVGAYTAAPFIRCPGSAALIIVKRN